MCQVSHLALSPSVICQKIAKLSMLNQSVQKTHQFDSIPTINIMIDPSITVGNVEIQKCSSPTMRSNLADIHQPQNVGADIGSHTGVAEATIRSTYKDLRPHASKLVPEWYAKGKNFDDLPAT